MLVRSFIFGLMFVLYNAKQTLQVPCYFTTLRIRED